MSLRAFERPAADERDIFAMFRSLGMTVLAIVALAPLAALVAFVRMFAFGYFHGDHAPMRGLLRILCGS
jgi:hypothetical protein